MAGWGGGNGGRVEEGRNFGSAFARLYILPYELQTKNTPKKNPALYFTNRKE